MARPPRRALVAEDSLVARIFLERLLVRRGFLVESVTTARGLSEALGRGPWSLVLADVELPDAPRAEHLAALAGTRSAPCVALVRDHADEERAAAAGLERHLRKPFESDHLDELLRSLGLGAAR